MRKINRPICPNEKALRTNYKHEENKRALIDASFGKCMYCETKITAIDHGDIEHIKPKSKYKHLEFDWNNLGFSCRICNQNKRDNYHENLPYINPYDENPSDKLIFIGARIYPFRGDDNADITIRNIGLNRNDLFEKRLTRIDLIQNCIATYEKKAPELKPLILEELLQEAAPDKEYSLAVETFLKAHKYLQDNNG